MKSILLLIVERNSRYHELLMFGAVNPAPDVSISFHLFSWSLLAYPKSFETRAKHVKSHISRETEILAQARPASVVLPDFPCTSATILVAVFSIIAFAWIMAFSGGNL